MKPTLALLACTAVALPALAQDAATDWDMFRDPDKKLIMAYARFDVGLSIATRCVNGSFEAVISGLPPAGRRETRSLGLAFGDDEFYTQRWNVAVNNTLAVSELPAPFARKLREGGRLRVFVPAGAGEGRNLTYDLALPASSASIDETLMTCGRPLTDPRDAELEALPEGGLPANLNWANPPRGSFPVGGRYARGFATIMCLSNPDGSLRDCTVEAEHPQGGGFGEAALRATRRARLGNAETSEGPVPLALILYRTNFVVEGYETREDEQRRREDRARERQARSNRQD
ncbi:hypothetical protein [Cypionkella sp.]|uniref:hypothetical protein n=1 Tax=Cypionkella sp. TaxID=2811411 RepID=UPI002AB95232|nr:hypothetical protein [Cypionkella sp.]MDZ4392800.1 hypothetical protein [Cypionkella sp.]